MAIISKTFKYRLKTNTTQSTYFAQWAGACRWLYNHALSARIKFYEDNKTEKKKSLSYVDQAAEIPDLRKTTETAWLSEVPYHLLQQSLRDLDRAYKNFFSKHAQFPQFHKKGRQDSFRFPDPKQIKVENNKRKGVIKLPKIGKVEFICSRENAFSGRLRNVTVVRDAGHWYVCLNCELEHEIPVNNGKSVGIDRGIAKSLVLSNGKQYDLPEARIKEIEAKIAYTQRRLTKKVKFSSNWKKVKVKVTNLHSRLARIRKDFLHKATTEITKNHGVVVLEDLKVLIPAMSAPNSGVMSARIPESPAKQVQLFARAILFRQAAT
jgi:putative transposase